MLHNLQSVNNLYKNYQTAGAELNKAVEETFREVFEDFGFVPIRFENTSVRPSTCDRLVQVNKFYFILDKLVFEDCDENVYPVEQIAYRPMNMYLIYQSFSKEIKIK